MHYYIDGYNLLFTSAWKVTGGNLEKMRAQLIEELDAEVALLPIQVTIVFDAPLQNEDLKRGHFRSLEIIFTSRGQTADDYLISLFQTLAAPKNAILVTSDRELQKRAKLFSVKSEFVDQFLIWLRKKSFKKKVKVSEKPAAKPVPLPSPKQSVPLRKKELEEKKQARQKKLQSVTQDELPALSDYDRWEELFAARLAELTCEEDKHSGRHAKKKNKKK